MLRLALMVVASLAAGSAASAQFADTSALKMVRSLQFVQDSIAMGDHSAIEMQRHLLALIDERLEAAGDDIFQERDTVEAALIYAMSGGNPATVAHIASSEDPAVDPRVLPLVASYLGGRGAAVGEEIAALLPDFSGSRLEPYLALIAANGLLSSEPAMALELYDRARLLAPGTIIEEAALRRSIATSVGSGRVEDGVHYAERYARRFLHSPYAGQFADLFVDLVVAHPETVRAERILQILANMDADRRRSVYLRIARKAAIAGNDQLAVETATAAQALGEDNGKVRALAGLYSGVAGVPMHDAADLSEELEAIDAAALSPRDLALRAAARRVADAVTTRPELDPVPVVDVSELPSVPAETEAMPEDGDTPIADFVDARRDVLQSVDQLLEEDR
ncbi:chemotaxis protein [Pararhizobium haloflavum]|uniref:chemotaxis protein n=1 Tax=Pararhizobium haloflavum TaxID=2037914 RepID=UPI0012FFD6A3|nr:chemotaxis protein [Pararhizobium haloflavum]